MVPCNNISIAHNFHVNIRIHYVQLGCEAKHSSLALWQFGLHNCRYFNSTNNNENNNNKNSNSNNNTTTTTTTATTTTTNYSCMLLLRSPKLNCYFTPLVLGCEHTKMWQRDKIEGYIDADKNRNYRCHLHFYLVLLISSIYLSTRT